MLCQIANLRVIRRHTGLRRAQGLTFLPRLAARTFWAPEPINPSINVRRLVQHVDNAREHHASSPLLVIACSFANAAIR